jgi:chromosome segregation ATPase
MTTQTELETQKHGGARSGAGRKAKATAPDIVAQLESERDELTREASALEQLETQLSPELKRHQSGLIAGDVEAVQSAAGVTARLNAARERSAEIVTRLPLLDAELDVAKRAAKQARLLDELRELANDSSRTFAELETERSRANAVLVEVAPKLKASRAALSEQRATFLRIVGDLSPLVYGMDSGNVSIERWNAAQPELEKVLAQFAELEKGGADLSALRCDLSGRYARSFDVALEMKPLEFGSVISSIQSGGAAQPAPMPTAIERNPFKRDRAT